MARKAAVRASLKNWEVSTTSASTNETTNSPSPQASLTPGTTRIRWRRSRPHATYPRSRKKSPRTGADAGTEDRRCESRHQHGRPSQFPFSHPGQGLVGPAQRKSFNARLHGDFRSEGQKILAVATREIGHRTDCPFAPNQLVRKRRDVAHVNAAADDRTPLL